MPVVDLNADVGEWDVEPPSSETELIAIISSANIACGVHAGNQRSMVTTVELAAAHNVSVGAHPSLNDRANFGRVETPVSPVAVFDLVVAQVGALADVARTRRVPMRHVKPHGALYNMAARDSQLADAIAEAVATVDALLVLVGLAGSELLAAGQRAGLRTRSEVFADRMYRADGSLVPRSTPGAVIDDPARVAARAVAMVRDGCVVAVDGSTVAIAAETICVHGDTPGAAVLARRVRASLTTAGIDVSSGR